MRIILINSPNHTPYPQPPLGLLSVASVCINQCHEVRILDTNARHIPLKKIIEEVDLYDTVGITAMSLNYIEACNIASAIKEVYPYKFLIIGGVHATVATEEVWESGIFSAVVAGEGEAVISVLLSEKRKGLYSGDIFDLNELPILPYHLLDGRRAKMSYGKHRYFMPLETSRGCPFRCSFCCRIFGNKYRAMSVDRVMVEIKVIRDTYGYLEIKFYDDVFTMDKARAVELSNRIGGDMAWTCMTRANLVDKVTLQAMKDGGCYSIAYGIESGDPEILKRISKNITLEQVEQAVRYSKEVGLRVIGYFMLGAPGETSETIKKTVDFASRLDVDYVQFSIATALPGSELYNLVLPALRANAYATNGVENPSLCELSPKQLMAELKQAVKRFKR